MAERTLALLGFLFVFGCGDDSATLDGSMPDADSGVLVDSAVGDAPADALGDGAASDARGDAVSSDAAPSDASAADAPDAASDCDGLIGTLQSELYESLACSTVVRLDHESLAVLGHQLFCGRYASVSESGARATLMRDTGFGTGATMLDSPDPEGTFVFYESPGDFGAVGMVSNLTGQTVFHGSIVWNGAGEITYPATWRSPDELGAGCPAVGGPIDGRGYDLVSGGALAEADVDRALDVIAGTALPAAIWGGGYVFNAVVLRYPRTVGAFDPSSAEWIVVVNGGWLE